MKMVVPKMKEVLESPMNSKVMLKPFKMVRSTVMVGAAALLCRLIYDSENKKGHIEIMS